MARAPKNVSALRNVREAARLTQEELAAKIGASRETIQKIEQGSMRLSNRIALQIRGQLGCALSTVGEGRSMTWKLLDKKLRDNDQYTPYTHDDYRSWRECMREEGLLDTDQWSESLSAALDLILRAAGRAGVLPALVEDVQMALVRWREDFGLDAALRGMLREDDEVDDETAGRWADLLEANPAVVGGEYKWLRRARLKEAWRGEDAGLNALAAEQRAVIEASRAAREKNRAQREASGDRESAAP